MDSEEVRARLHRPLLDALDAWIDLNPDPKLTRPEAVRRILALHLDVSAS